MLSKKYTKCIFLGQFSPFKDDAIEPRYIWTKTSKFNLFEVKSVCGIHVQTFPQECNTRKLQRETWPTDEKVSFQQTLQLYSPTERIWKEAVSNFLHLCPNNFWAPGRRDVCFSKKSSFFLVFAGQKHIGRGTSDRLFDCVHQHLSEKKHYCKRIGATKAEQILKLENEIFGFQKKPWSCIITTRRETRS